MLVVENKKNQKQKNVLTLSVIKMKRVIKSTTEAESSYFIEGLEHAINLQTLICEMLKMSAYKVPIEAIIDQKDLYLSMHPIKIKLSQTTVYVSRKCWIYEVWIT